jgi:broad specificity polyphosphatase/5'/3'-nucleotidase SurE
MMMDFSTWYLLIAVMSEIGEVVVVAPDKPQSAMGTP